MEGFPQSAECAQGGTFLLCIKALQGRSPPMCRMHPRGHFLWFYPKPKIPPKGYMFKNNNLFNLLISFFVIYKS
jgi:hypothetical protein